MSRTERLINLMKMREAMRAQRQARAVGELSGEIGRAKSTLVVGNSAKAFGQGHHDLFPPGRC